MNYDVIIIGGNPAGGAAAVAAKKLHRDKSILVIRKEQQSLIPCGIPYVFGSLDNIEDNIKSIEPAKKLGIEFLIDEVISIDTENKTITLKSGKTATFNKLIIATGSTPFIPPIKGADLDGVYVIRKQIDYIKSIIKPLKTAKNIVVIGAGFIGLEMSDELAKIDKNVTLIESMGSILPLAFDEDMTEQVAKVLKSHGVNIKTNTVVDEIIGENGAVSGVKFKNGEIIKADKVILSIGYKSNTTLAQECGIDIGVYGGIITDEYLRTNKQDIFAVGDCVEHRDFFTRKPSKILLASTAASEARIAGMNLFDLRVIRQTKGSIAIFSSSLHDISMGAAGLTVKQANAEGFNIIIGESKGFDHHPSKLHNTFEVKIKLIFSKSSGVILGAQITGGPSTGEMINILGVAIQKHMTASELAIIQYGTQPMLTAGPGDYPIVIAAMNAVQQMCK
jgi:NADPH-dependent 2,4-dienoyl-CoA reductase/sulfur reductase-like enzyme